MTENWEDYFTIGTDELEALEQILRLCLEQPGTFDKILHNMLKVGMAEVRRYCTPLQAFFWLLQDGQTVLAGEIFARYSLEELLCLAWPARNLYQVAWPEGRIAKQPGGCVFPQMKFPSYVLVHSLDFADYLLYRARLNPETFEFMVEDEQYIMDYDPRVQVLATALWQGEAEPVVWIKDWGKGKVFYIALGHARKECQNETFKLLLNRGALWTADRLA